jgi:cytochrome c
MRRVVFAVIGLVLFSSVASVALSMADDREAEIQQLVDRAVAFYQEKGRDYALKVLNASHGPFIKGPIYTFTAQFDGRLIAHPVNKELLKINQYDLQDAKGKYFFREMVDVAKNPGSGWTEYWWLRHGEREPVMKRSYIKRVPSEEVFIGAGYYVK